MEIALNTLAMGYRPLWNAQRKLAGVQLFLHEQADTQADIAHFLRMMRELWTPASPRLLFSAQSPALLQQLLTHMTAHIDWALEVRADWVQASESLQTSVCAALSAGVQLVWRGAMAQWPQAAQSAWYACGLLHMQPADALKPDTPVQGGMMYEGMQTQAHVQQCFEAFKACAVAGWPTQQVLQALQGVRAQQPSHAHVKHLMEAVQTDQSLDVLEIILSEDPLLAYRFMLYANSAALGVRTGIHSIRGALLMLGYSTLGDWLNTQCAYVSDEQDLNPIRRGAVMRAQLTAQLMDVGISHELYSDVYLCGLFAHLHETLDELQEATLTRLPLSERIVDAVVHHSGPYATSLQLAQAMEQEDGAATIRVLCEAQDVPLEFVNRSLLRVMSEWNRSHGIG